MTVIKIPYDGKAASLDEQIALLKQSGVYILDEKTARNHLSFVGYYRLFAYVKPFLPNLASPITFEQVWSLYNFDRKLRILIIDAIERIEVAFRVSISEVMSLQYHPFWYTSEEHFNYLRWHAEFMGKVLQLTHRQEHALIKHFYKNYLTPNFPPSWMMTECLTFGTWSKVFHNIKKRSDKIAVANRLHMRLMPLLSWIKCLTELRNLCAHHDRIWNHFFRHTPKDVPCAKHQEHRFYQQAYVLKEMLQVISPYSGWVERLKSLMEEHQHLPLEKMGFSKDWLRDPLWNNLDNESSARPSVTIRNEPILLS